MQRSTLFRLTALLVTCLMLFASSQPALTAPNQTTRVSVGTDGQEGDGYSSEATLSDDGRFVAFQSSANNLAAEDTNEVSDIFIHDRLTGETTVASVASDGEQANGYSLEPAISGDGRFVAFQSSATNLVAEDTSTTVDIFVHDLHTGETTRVSVTSNGTEANKFSDNPAISGDGRYVTFRSLASNLATGCTNGTYHIFVHDRQNGTTTCVSVDSSGVQGNGASELPAISADGNTVVFRSIASDLVAGDNNNTVDIFIHNLLTDETTLASVASGGEQANRYSSDAAISGDGRFVAFRSDATNLVPVDTNGNSDIFVHDRQSKETTLSSVNSAGEQGVGNAYMPTLSWNGRFVAFVSNSTNLIAEGTNSNHNVFVHNLQTDETLLASAASNGTQGDDNSFYPSLSGDGRYVGFISRATNLVHGDTNMSDDVFVRGLPYPEVTVEQALGQPDPTVSSPINFTATFTKPIDSTTFDGSDVLLGGTAGPSTATVTEIAPNDGTTFNITINGLSAYGTVTASIPYDVLEDLEGYTNAPSTSTDSEVFYAHTMLIFPLFLR